MQSDLITRQDDPRLPKIQRNHNPEFKSASELEARLVLDSLLAVIAERDAALAREADKDVLLGFHEATEAHNRDLQAELADAREREKRLRDALALFVDIMNQYGEWDDGCFYYEKRSATELQRPIELARAALAKENTPHE